MRRLLAATVAEPAEIVPPSNEEAPAAETVAEAVAVEDAASDSAAVLIASPAAEPSAEDLQTVPEAAVESAPGETSVDALPPMEAPAGADAGMATAETASSSPPVAAEATSAQAAEAAKSAPAEPEMIDVWRPGRSEGRARPHRKQREGDRHFGRHGAAEAATPGPTADTATAASTPERGAPSEPAGDQPAGAEAGQPERHSRQRRRQGPTSGSTGRAGNAATARPMQGGTSGKTGAKNAIKSGAKNNATRIAARKRPTRIPLSPSLPR